MPNSRRRRFSVRNGIAGREPCKLQNNLPPSQQDPDPDFKPTTQNSMTTKSSKTKAKINANMPKNSTNMSMPAQSSSVSVNPIINRRSNNVINVDKDVTASSSNIDLFNLIHSSDEVAELCVDTTEAVDSILKKPVLQESRERTPLRRDKHPRQHRIKVRSPKRRSVIIDQPNKTIENKLIDVKNNSLRSHVIDKNVLECNIRDNKSSSTNENIIIHTSLTVSVATEPINWKQEVEEVEEVCTPGQLSEASEEERQSDHSLDDMCRICHGGDSLNPELGQLISACACRGTVGRVHVKCLERWLTESGKSRCELCGTRYITRRVHRYGVPRALLMWILSQNAKQLMVDSLGIMLMSPLAVLAAWLSGRTLAGLMTQDSHATPWPLASTFVLACMTLVCYYCWIVSAATRHALGWWIWYRSQYEVRLQLQNDEE